jgi:peptide-methionine (R)-S-oxide reductase
VNIELAEGGKSYQRRAFLGLVAAGTLAWAWSDWRTRVQVREADARLPATVKIVEFSVSGQRIGAATVPAIRKSDSDWKRQLAVDQYMVTRRADTELAFTGQYWNFHGDGIYRCVCCATALFDSRTKFESGTGWPSFTEPLAKENVVELPDTSFGATRTEVKCARCDGHLGHVFQDGPPPTGRRYCMNSVALRFVARQAGSPST